MGRVFCLACGRDLPSTASRCTCERASIAHTLGERYASQRTSRLGKVVQLAASLAAHRGSNAVTAADMRAASDAARGRDGAA